MNYIVGLLSFLITNKYIMYIILAFTCFLILLNSKKKKLIVPTNFSFIMLLLFGVSYILFALYNNTFNILVVVYPIVMYFIGASLYNSKPTDKNIIIISNSIIFGLVLHAAFNYFTNVDSLNRNVVDIFSKINLAATLQATFIIMFLSTFFTNMQRNKLIKKILYIVLCILCLLFILLIGSRTSILIFAITSIYSLAAIILYKNGNVDERKRKLKVLFSIIISIVVIITLYNNNTFKIKQKVESSHLYYRLTVEKLDGADEGRYNYQYLGIISLFNNPFGTKEKIGRTNYVHNMWLDIGKDAGIICFALLVAYSISTIKSLIMINKNSKVEKMFKIYFNSLYLGVFLNFLVEPILEGIPLYFGFFVLINAMVDMYSISIYKKIR